MGDALEYLARRHEDLSEEYTEIVEGKRFAASCTVEALDIAELLLKEGQEPRIVSVRGLPVSSQYIIANKTLNPVRYSGKVSWGGHVICVVGNQVYDPMVAPEPVSLGKYPELAFGSPVMMTERFTTDNLQKHFSAQRVD